MITIHKDQFNNLTTIRQLDRFKKALVRNRYLLINPVYKVYLRSNHRKKLMRKLISRKTKITIHYLFKKVTKMKKTTFKGTKVMKENKTR